MKEENLSIELILRESLEDLLERRALLDKSIRDLESRLAQPPAPIKIDFKALEAEAQEFNNLMGKFTRERRARLTKEELKYEVYPPCTEG